MEVLVVADANAVAAKLAERFVARAADAIASRGRAVVVLAGGSTPRAAYERLGSAPLRDRLDLARLEIFFGDERCVPPDHADSNYRMASDAWLVRVAIDAARVHRIEAERAEPDDAAMRYESELRRACGVAAPTMPHLDLVLLGMGPDGHTASLFPSSPALAESKRLFVAAPGPAGARRVTATYPLLNAARAVVFAASGVEKAPALRRVFAHDPAMPSARVVPVDGSLTWIVDRALADAAGVEPSGGARLA